MMTKSSSQPRAPVQTKMSLPMTVQTLTACLAYCAYYTPKLLPRGRFIAPKQLRQLAQWIEQPMPKLLSIRQHRLLAAHFALLHATNLIHLDDYTNTVQPTDQVRLWLACSHSQQIKQLLAALTPTDSWSQTVTRLGLQKVMTIDLVAYLRQLLERYEGKLGTL